MTAARPALSRNVISMVRIRLLLLTLLPVFLVGVTAARADYTDNYGIDTATSSLTSLQAGAHADYTANIRWKVDPGVGPYAGTHEYDIEMPAGLNGDPTGYPECDLANLTANAFSTGVPCPQDSQVGVAKVFLNAFGFEIPVLEPLYNLKPKADEPARFGIVAGAIPIIIDTAVRSESDYGVTAKTIMVDETGVSEIDTTIWGVPGDPSHDHLRLNPLEAFCGFACNAPGGNRASQIGPVPFLTNPTSCGPVATTLRSDSWPHPGDFKVANLPLGTITGCDKLDFKPTMTVKPTTSAAGSATGLDVDLTIPQTKDPNLLATANLRDAGVTLPAGMTLNSAAADGLGSCSSDQVGFGTERQSACPDDSKIGTATVLTPELPTPLSGALYQRTPSDGQLLRIWLVSDDQGVHLKLPGEIHADPRTGQLTTSFDDNPQQPVSELQLHFRGGDHGVLVTPSQCGSYTTDAQLTPWSSDTPVSSPSTFTIGQNCDQAARFEPALNAGLRNAQAGSSSGFTLQLTRPDGEENISQLTTVLPPGLVAKLAGVPLCSDLLAASGNCPSGSQVGSTTVGTGAGPTPLYIPQAGKSPTAVYLAGAYKGAPFSLVITVPAQAGPFDLGTVTVRAALFVDPTDAHVTVVADPLPQIMQGIPLSYRDIRVTIDRPGFMQAPTSCAPMQIAADVVPAAGGIALSNGVGYATGGGPAARVSSSFQVGGCQDLGFSPSLKMALSGKGKTRSGNHPTLTATLTDPSGQANIRSAKVALPLSLALDPNNSQHVCSYDVAQAVHGASVGCPASTIVGQATAVTPLLSQSLTGPVYLVQGIRFGAGGQRIHTLPSLLIPLRGQIALDLRAQSAVSGGKLVTTFATIPDAPVSRFNLTINGGPKGLLVITGRGKTVCGKAQVSNAHLGAQSGKADAMNPTLATPACGKPASLRAARVVGHAVHLTVQVPAAGRLVAQGAGLRSQLRHAGGAGTVRLVLPAQAAKLDRTGRLRTRVTLNWTPRGGGLHPMTTRTLTIRR